MPTNESDGQFKNLYSSKHLGFQSCMVYHISFLFRFLKMATVLLLWCVLVKCIQGFAQGPGHAEGRRFESISTREDWKLAGHVFKVLRSPSLLSCSQTCLTSWQCRSTNFEVVSATGEGICELNNECSTEEMAEDFTRQAGFVYTQYGERIVEVRVSRQNQHFFSFL